MCLGNIKGVVEMNDRIMESKSFHWQMEELMKKSETKLLPRGLKKNSERAESQKANSSWERVKNVAERWDMRSLKDVHGI